MKLSILAELSAKTKKTGVFGVVAGPRLSGKSTLAGTLPGTTYLLQAAGRETGSESAAKLARENGNSLEIGTFHNLRQLDAALHALAESDFDNVYIDGISAITDMKYLEPEVQKTMKKNNWDAFREIGQAMEDFIMLAKSVAEDHGKNVFMTLAMKEKYDSMSQLINLDPECKGNATIGKIKGLCPTILIPRVAEVEEEGKVVLHRELVTSIQGPWTARIDGLLDHENPGTVEVKGPGNGLAAVIKLIKGE